VRFATWTGVEDERLLVLHVACGSALGSLIFIGAFGPDGLFGEHSGAELTNALVFLPVALAVALIVENVLERYTERRGEDERRLDRGTPLVRAIVSVAIVELIVTFCHSRVNAVIFLISPLLPVFATLGWLIGRPAGRAVCTCSGAVCGALGGLLTALLFSVVKNQMQSTSFFTQFHPATLVAYGAVMGAISAYALCGESVHFAKRFAKWSVAAWILAIAVFNVTLALADQIDGLPMLSGHLRTWAATSLPYPSVRGVFVAQVSDEPAGQVCCMAWFSRRSGEPLDLEGQWELRGITYSDRTARDPTRPGMDLQWYAFEFTNLHDSKSYDFAVAPVRDRGDLEPDRGVLRGPQPIINGYIPDENYPATYVASGGNDYRIDPACTVRPVQEARIAAIREPLRIIPSEAAGVSDETRETIEGGFAAPIEVKFDAIEDCSTVGMQTMYMAIFQRRLADDGESGEWHLLTVQTHASQFHLLLPSAHEAEEEIGVARVSTTRTEIAPVGRVEETVHESYTSVVETLLFAQLFGWLAGLAYDERFASLATRIRKKT
jgi:hypothetical protein